VQSASGRHCTGDAVGGMPLPVVEARLAGGIPRTAVALGCVYEQGARRTDEPVPEESCHFGPRESAESEDTFTSVEAE
jgi:hypothetical protein